VKGNRAVLVGAAIAVAVLGAWSYVARAEFEKRARSAERFAAEQRHVIQMKDDEIAELSRRREARAPVIERDRTAIATADAANPPPDSCQPNLAARDKTIADQAAQIADDSAQLAAEHVARAELQRAHDALAAALASRPKSALLRLAFLEIERPALGPFIGLNADGKVVTGVGISIPIRIGGH
jgi:hypothetical protein